ncbi:syntaxin-binding protein 5-like isoform X1, partial [Tachysurus ichikawai]
PYPSYVHNEPRGTVEPVSNLRTSHYSPVFYLLDNGKTITARHLERLDGTVDGMLL